MASPLLLLGADGRVRYANRAGQPLASMVARRPAALAKALPLAREGARPWLRLPAEGHGGARRATRAACLRRLQLPAHDGPAPLLLAAAPDDEALAPTLALYAESLGLTPTEERALDALRRGLGPEAAAAALGVELTTLRSHLAALRRKAGRQRSQDVVTEMLSLTALADGESGATAARAAGRAAADRSAAHATRRGAAAGAAAAANGAADTPAEALAALLDELACALVLLGPGGRVLHANAAARTGLAGSHPLQLRGQTLSLQPGAAGAAAAGHWPEALTAARAGHRRLLWLEPPARARVGVRLSPLVGGAVLLAVGRPPDAPPPAWASLASAWNLTPAERSVLHGLACGLSPQAIAERQGVALSTVRTQIGHLRAKAGAAGVSALRRQLAQLPPLAGS